MHPLNYSYLKVLLVGTVVQKGAKTRKENFCIVIKKGNIFAFVNKLQRVTDYLLQKLQKLFEPF
jgi:hypothetical protein